jgi:predicted RNA-binding protein
MNYWIIALPRPDMENCIKVGAFGANRKGIVGYVEEGDKVACYITKEYKIIALGTVTQGYYLDDEKIFLREGVFPDRFKFSAKQLKPDDELNFMTIVDKMSFIKNLAYWSAHFRNGILRMSETDWDLMQAKISAPNK